MNATSSWGDRRKLPYVFTEHGVLMLSSVLSSPRAVQVNIQVMRVYTKLREVIASNHEILAKLEEMEQKVDEQDERIHYIFNYLKRFVSTKKDRSSIGYKT